MGRKLPILLSYLGIALFSVLSASATGQGPSRVVDTPAELVADCRILFHGWGAHVGRLRFRPWTASVEALGAGPDLCFALALLA